MNRKYKWNWNKMHYSLQALIILITGLATYGYILIGLRLLILVIGS